MTTTAMATDTAPDEGANSVSGEMVAVRHPGFASALRPPGFTIAADGSYAARLAPRGEVWCAERWSLDSAEPYAVPLPVEQPEEPGTEVLPLADGRVLVHRFADGRHLFSLLYPTGPGTGQLALGAVETAELTLLPPSPSGSCAYALAPGERSSSVWLVAGGAFGPELVAQVPGRCSGGVWLDRTGRMLALDQERDGRVKTVAVDLERGGEVSPLLQIGDDSDDRLLLADPGSGFIVVRSDAPGHDRLGWGQLGSTRPIHFPDALRLEDCVVTPFAIQPGQVLSPESCAVGLRIDGAAGSWLGVWSPQQRRAQQLAAPYGWLGCGLWSPDQELLLPYVTEDTPCGLARVTPPEPEPVQLPEPVAETAPVPAPSAPRPVPLQQAPLTGRLAAR